MSHCFTALLTETWARTCRAYERKRLAAGAHERDALEHRGARRVRVDNIVKLDAALPWHQFHRSRSILNKPHASIQRALMCPSLHGALSIKAPAQAVLHGSRPHPQTTHLQWMGSKFRGPSSGPITLGATTLEPWHGKRQDAVPSSMECAPWYHTPAPHSPMPPRAGEMGTDQAHGHTLKVVA